MRVFIQRQIFKPLGISLGLKALEPKSSRSFFYLNGTFTWDLIFYYHNHPNHYHYRTSSEVKTMLYKINAKSSYCWCHCLNINFIHHPLITNLYLLDRNNYVSQKRFCYIGRSKRRNHRQCGHCQENRAPGAGSWPIKSEKRKRILQLWRQLENIWQNMAIRVASASILKLF